MQPTQLLPTLVFTATLTLREGTLERELIRFYWHKFHYQCCLSFWFLERHCFELCNCLKTKDTNKELIRPEAINSEESANLEAAFNWNLLWIPIPSGTAGGRAFHLQTFTQIFSNFFCWIFRACRLLHVIRWTVVLAAVLIWWNLCLHDQRQSLRLLPLV